MATPEPTLALVAEAGVDLSPLTERLWANSIPHRVVSDADGRQCIYLADEQHMPQVKQWLQEWQQGDLQEIDKQSSDSQLSLLFYALWRTPFSSVLMLVFIAVYAWMNTTSDWYQWLISGQSLWPEQRFALSAYLDMGFWKLWRPVLLHFSFVHLVMNMFWWWLLARAVEMKDGYWAVLFMLLVCGLASNAAQWWYAGPAFGGASGVTLGLLAWVVYRQKVKKIAYDIPDILLPVMVGWLLITLIWDTFGGMTSTAHAAHFSGLMIGCLIAAVWPTRMSHNTTDKKTTTDEP